MTTLRDRQKSALELDFPLSREDDIGFVHLFRPIVLGAITASSAPEIYVVKIDSWFGPNWLGFSHKVLGAFGVSLGKLRLPPFVPARVRSESYHRLHEDRDSRAELQRAQPLHVRQTSADNQWRVVGDIYPNAALFWWSGNTLTNARGCLTGYLPTAGGHTCWYAGFRKNDRWLPADLRNTSRMELERYAKLGGAN